MRAPPRRPAACDLDPCRVARPRRPAADGDVFPHSLLGQVLAAAWALCGLVLMVAFSSIASARLTSTLLSSSATIESLSQVTGAACVEVGYPLLDRHARRPDRAPRAAPALRKQRALRRSYVALNLDAHVPRYMAELPDCFEGLANGTYQVVVADRTTTVWYVWYMGLRDAYVSGQLSQTPFAFTLTAGSALRAALNPLVLLVHSDNPWAPIFDQLSARFFPEPAPIAREAQRSVDTQLIVGAVVAAGVSFLVAGLLPALARWRRGGDAAGDAGGRAPEGVRESMTRSLSTSSTGSRAARSPPQMPRITFDLAAGA